MNDRWWHGVDPCQQDLEGELLVLAAIAPESLPCHPETPGETTVDEAAPGIVRFLAPIVLPENTATRESKTVWACGTIQTSLPVLVAKLFRLNSERHALGREVAELRAGLTPHLEQISHDFEELTWLRQLNDRFENCDVRNSLEEVVPQILPDLCRLVHAEGMFFVSADNNLGSTEPVVAGAVARLQVRTGFLPLDAAGCRNLVEALRRDEKPGHPLVVNHARFPERYPQFPEVHSCIHIPVMHQGQCFGWLLALNRIPWALRATGDRDLVPTTFSEDEFGTCDAAMMQAAVGPLAAHAHNTALFQEKELLLINAIRAIINALDAKDEYTCGHSDRVATFARCIGRQLEFDSQECERLYMAGLLHDIGKIGVPDEVLKKPGKLTEEEFAKIKLHPGIGYAILCHVPQISYVLPGVLHHHESVNGKGYPHGLRGDEIPLSGRILAVADAFDAMTSCRPYRSAMPVEKAEAILRDGAGTQWDARIVQAFLECAPEVRAACAGVEVHEPEQATPASVLPHSQVHSRPDTIAQSVALIGN